MQEHNIEGSSFTLNFILQTGDQLIDQIMQKIESASKTQSAAMDKMRQIGTGVGGVGRSGDLPEFGGVGSLTQEIQKRLQEHCKKIESMMAAASSVDDGAQKLLQMLDQFINASSGIERVISKKYSVPQKSIIQTPSGPVINPSARGFKFQVGGRNVISDVGLTVGKSSERQLEGGILSREDLLALSNFGGSVRIGESVKQVTKGTPLDILNALLSMRTPGGAVSLKNVHKVPSEQLSESEIREEDDIKRRGIRRSAITSYGGMDLTQFREYVELQRRLSDAIGTMHGSSKGITDSTNIGQLGAAYQIVRRALDGQSGVVHLAERLSASLSAVSQSIPQIATLGSQFRGMLDPIRQIDVALRSIISSLNKIHGAKISTVNNVQNVAQSPISTKVAPNFDPAIKQVASEITSLRAELSALRQSINTSRSGVSGLHNSALTSSRFSSVSPYGLGISGIQKQTLSASDPLLNPGYMFFRKINRETESFNNQIDIAIKRVALYASAAGGVWGLVRAFTAGAKVISETETQMAELQFLMNSVRTDFKALRQDAFEIAKTFGFSISSTLDAMVVFAQQGRSMKDTIHLVTASLAISNQTTMTATAATEALTAAMALYNIKAEDSMRIADAWANVVNKNAVSAEVLSAALKKAGGSAVAAGVDFDQLNGMITVINEATRKSGSEIGTSLKYIFKNLVAPETVSLLEKLGVAVFNASGNIRPTLEIFSELNEKMASFTDIQRRQVLVTIASARHYSDFNIILRDMDKVYKVISQSQDSFGTSARNNAIVIDTLAKQWQNLKTTFAEVAVEIGSGGVLNAVKLLVSGLKGIAAIGSLIPDSLKGIVTAGALFAGGISVIARAINGLTGLALPSVLERMAAYRHSMIMNSVESTKYSQILLRESAAVETLANSYSRLNASMVSGATRYAATATRYASVATPGGVPTALPSAPVSFWSSGKGQASIAGASLVGSVLFGNLARSSRQGAGNSNTLGSTFFETMQGVSTGALVGTAFGGARGALVGGAVGGTASFLGAMKDYKSTLEVSYEINKKNLQIYRDQIEAVQQIQEEIQKTANVRIDPLTNKPVSASSVTISPIQSRLMVYETLARMGQVGLKSSNEILRQVIPGGADAYGLAATKFSDSLYNVAKSNEELSKFIADLRETMEDLKFETAKSALQLGKAKMEDLRAQADILRKSGGMMSGSIFPRFVHVGVGRVVGGTTQVLGDTINWAGSKIGAGGDNWLGNFMRRSGQSAQSYANLMDKFKEIGDENIARIIVDMQILQETNEQIQSYFDMYRTIVGKFENASKSATLTRGFYRSALGAAATPYSPEMRKAIEGIGEEDYTAMRKLHYANPLAAREAESVAQAINQKFFNQFYNTRNLTGIIGNLDYQKTLIRNQGWDSTFAPFRQNGNSPNLIVRELRVGDIIISGKRQEIITGIDDKSITSLGIRQDPYGLLNIEQHDGETIIRRTREEYEKFIASLDESETVFARVGSSGRSFSGLTGDIEKDSNALVKVFGRLQEIFNKEFSLIKRNLDYAAIGGQYNIPVQSIASSQAAAQLNTLLNRTNMTISPLELQSPTDVLQQIGRTDLIAMLEKSSSAEDRLRESIDKLIEVTNKSLYDEIRSRAMTKASLAENAIDVLEKSSGNQKALLKFFAESNIPFTGQERDELMSQGKEAVLQAARRRVKAIPYDQAVGSGNLPGDLQAMSIQLSEAMRSGGIGAREALRRIKEAEAVIGLSIEVARKRNLDIIRNQENITLSRQNPDAISTESFGDLDLSGVVDFDPSKLQAYLENLQKVSTTLSDFIVSVENQKITQQFDAIKKSIDSFGTSLSSLEISLRTRNIADILTKQVEDLEMARRQFLSLGELLYGFTDELGRRRPTSELTAELSSRMEQSPDLLRTAIGLPAQKTIGTVIAKAQENISLFTAKQNIFGVFRQDSDVTQSVVGEYKGMVDSLIAERQRLIKDGYYEEVSAIDNLIAKYKELNDKMEGQNRQLSPRRQQFLELAAKDILSQGIPLIGINDEIRSIIGQNARLRQYGVETGSLMGVSTKEAQDLAQSLEAQSDTIMERLRSMRDKIGESFKEADIGVLKLQFTGLEDLEEKLRQYQENGVEIPVKFRISNVEGLFSFREGKIVPFEKPAESLARGGKVKRDGVLARLHHGEVVIPSHLSGQLPEYITSQLGNIAPQGGILPMATGGIVQPEINILFSNQFKKMLAKILPNNRAFFGMPEHLGESTYDLLHLAQPRALQASPYLHEVLTKPWHMLLRQRLQDLVEPREDYWRGTDNYNEQDLIRRGVLAHSRHMNLGYREKGLSVWRGTHFLDAYDYGYGYGIAGDVVGIGADTEPLLSTKKARLTTGMLTRQEIHDLVDAQYQQNLRRIQWHPLAYLSGIASPPLMDENYRFLPIQAPKFLYMNSPRHLPIDMRQYADLDYPHDPADYFDTDLKKLYLRKLPFDKRYSRLSPAARFSSPEDIFDYLSTRRLSTPQGGRFDPTTLGVTHYGYPKSVMFINKMGEVNDTLFTTIHEATHLIESNMKEFPLWNKILAHEGVSEDIVFDFLSTRNPKKRPSSTKVSNFAKFLRNQSDNVFNKLSPLSALLIHNPKAVAEYYDNPRLTLPYDVDIMYHAVGNRRHPLLEEITPTYFEALLRISNGESLEGINAYFSKPDRVVEQVGGILTQYPDRFPDLHLWKQIVENPSLRTRLLDIQPTMSYRDFNAGYQRHLSTLRDAAKIRKRYSRTSSAPSTSSTLATPSTIARTIMERRRRLAFGAANPDLTQNIQLNPLLPGSMIDASGQITIGFTQDNPAISGVMETLAKQLESGHLAPNDYLKGVLDLSLRGHALYSIFDITQIPHELGHMAEGMQTGEKVTIRSKRKRSVNVPAPSYIIQRLGKYLQKNYAGSSDPNNMLISEVFKQKLIGLDPTEQITLLADKENILRGKPTTRIIDPGEFWRHVASEVFTELLTGTEHNGKFGRYQVDPKFLESNRALYNDILRSMLHPQLRPVLALAERMRDPRTGLSLQQRIFESLVNANNPLTEKWLSDFLLQTHTSKLTLPQTIFEYMRNRRIIGTTAKHTGLALLGGVLGNAILGPAWAPTGVVLGATLPFMFGSGRQKAIQLRGSLWGGIMKSFAIGMKGGKGIYGGIRSGFQSASSFLKDRKKVLNDIISERRAISEYTKQYAKTRFPDVDMKALRSKKGLPPSPMVFAERLRQQIELFDIIRSRPELADILPRPTLATSIPNRIRQTQGVLAVLSPTSTGTLSPVDVQRQILSNESVIRGIHERLVGADLVDWTIPRTFTGTPTTSRFSRTAESLSRPRYGHLGGLGLNVFAMASPFLEAGAESRSIAPGEVMSMGLMVGGIEAAQRIGGWASTSRMPWLRAGGKGIGAGMGTLFAGLSIAHAAEGVSDVAEGNENYWSALMKTAGRTSIAGGMAKGGAASLGAAGLLTPGLVGLALPLTTIALGSGALASSVRMKNIAKELEERQKRADLIRQRTIQGGSLRRSEKDKRWEWVPANAKTRWQKRLEDLALASGETNPANFELAGKQMLKKSYLGNIIDSKIRNRIFEDLTKDKDGRDLLFKALGIEHEQKTDSLGWFEMPFWGSDWKKRVQQENVSEILHKSGKSQQEIDEAVANIISASPEFGSLAAARMLHSGIKPRVMQQRIESRESYWLAKGLRDFVAKGNNFMGQSISPHDLAGYLSILGEENEDYTLNKGLDSIRDIEVYFYELMSKIPVIQKGAPKRLYELQQRLIQNSLINYGTVPSQLMSKEQISGLVPVQTRLIDNPLSIKQAYSDVYSPDPYKRDRARDYLYNRWRTAAHRGGTTNSAMPYYGFGDMDMTAMDQYGRPIVIRTDEMIIPKSSITPSNGQSVLINNNKTINVKVGGGFQIINQKTSDDEDITRIIRENASEIARKITDEIINKPIAIYS